MRKVGKLFENKSKFMFNSLLSVLRENVVEYGSKQGSLIRLFSHSPCFAPFYDVL